MATSKSTESKEGTQYSTGKPEDAGKPVGPEHDQSFSAPDFYDPQTGKRIETPWDSEAQKNDPGFDPDVMAGTVEQPSGGEGGETTAPAPTPKSSTS